MDINDNIFLNMMLEYHTEQMDYYYNLTNLDEKLYTYYNSIGRKYFYHINMRNYILNNNEYCFLEG